MHLYVYVLYMVRAAATYSLRKQFRNEECCIVLFMKRLMTAETTETCSVVTFQLNRNY
jgi:hypothetical protein